jgi:type II secretion system protein H
MGRPGGFTLLEILIVLFVISLVTSLAGLALNSGGRDMEFDAQVRQLADISSYALEEAQATGRDMGLYLERAYEAGLPVYRYRWLQRRAEGWRPPEIDEALFGIRQLPPQVEVALVLDDLPLPELEPDTGDSERDLVPQVLFYASGETTPGVLELRSADSGDILWRIDWDLLGRFELLRRGEPEGSFDEA